MSSASLAKRLLAHPLTRGLAVDDPRTTELRREIIRTKRFLRTIYAEWYAAILARLPRLDHVLEIGSGAGFFDQLLPQAITSEVFPTPGVRLVADACQLPFADRSLDAIVMTDVFHHIPDVARFLNEASRCLAPGGRIVMVEPWRTPWSEWVYTHLHPEPFLPAAADWRLPPSGPLSGANGALPWIVFERDRAQFERRWPRLGLREVQPLMPLAYLVSGGVSMRSLAPGWCYPLVRACERVLPGRRSAMFALIDIEAR